jgi:hypothetical protein
LCICGSRRESRPLVDRPRSDARIGITVSVRRSVVSIVAISLVAMSVIVYGAPRLAAVVRLALQFAPLTMEERRSTLFGPWYGNVQKLKQTIPPSAAVDFVMVRSEARDLAVLSGALLQPRDCRYFQGWDGWRRRQRVEFLLDARAANAPPGPPPAAASFVILVDPAATDALLFIRNPQ